MNMFKYIVFCGILNFRARYLSYEATPRFVLLFLVNTSYAPVPRRSPFIIINKIPESSNFMNGFTELREKASKIFCNIFY